MPRHLTYSLPQLSALSIWAYGIFNGNRSKVSAAELRPWARFEQGTPLLSAAATAVANAQSPEKQSTAPLIVNIREDEAAECLERLATRTPEELQRIDFRSNINGVLELVYRELRTSRWSLGKEAAGVLRKLFTTPPSASTAVVTPVVTRPSTPNKEEQKEVGDAAKTTEADMSADASQEKDGAPAGSPKAATSADNVATSPQKENTAAITTPA